jgi:histidinol phosphatase-like PHP family hydrolase
MQKIDLHIHTVHSDSPLTVAEVARRAKRAHVIAGICDHLSPYHKMFEPGAFDAYVADVRQNHLPVGAEYCIGEEIPVDGDRLDQLDYLLGGVHAVTVDGTNYFFWGSIPPPEEEAFVESYLQTTLAALAADPLDVLAHPTYLPAPFVDRYEEIWTDERCAALWEAAAARGIAVEISGRWLVPRERQLRLACDVGLAFAVGSDAHRAAELFNVTYPFAVVERLGIPEERLFLPRPKPA